MAKNKIWEDRNRQSLAKSQKKKLKRTATRKSSHRRLQIRKKVGETPGKMKQRQGKTWTVVNMTIKGKKEQGSGKGVKFEKEP